MSKVKYYCISLVDREDRRKLAKRLFERLKIEVEWWIVERHPEGGCYGCFESHLQVWRDECEEKYKCIFEDDLDLFEDDCVKRFMKCIKDIEKNGVRECDLLNLEPGTGQYEDDGWYFSSNPKDEFRVGFATRTGCYIGESSRLKDLSFKLEKYFGMDIDIALYGRCKMAACVVPIFRQNKELGTDNTGGVHDVATYVSNYGLEFSREIFTLVPGIGRAYLNILQKASSSYSKRSNDLRDRRVKVNSTNSQSSSSK